MGFFSLKVNCGVCGNEVGLNRFSIPKSNAWVCPECLKKVGGVTQINSRKITIEELKELVNAATQKQTQRADKAVNNPMRTAEGMYNYCVKNGFGSGWNDK